MKSICEAPSLKNKRILLRVDFNVPIEEDKIIDNSRILRSLPTIRYLLDSGCSQIIIATHLGRPKGQFNRRLSTKILQAEIEALLRIKVGFVNDYINSTINLEEKIVLLENLRFHKEEKENDAHFAKILSNHVQIYVNDAFSCSHRTHASIVGVAKYIPSYLGILIEEEISYLKDSIRPDLSPKVAIIAGKKVSTKINILANLLPKLDKIIIAGAMANTFFKAKGLHIGNSFFESGYVEKAKEILHRYPEKLIIPHDVTCLNSQGEALIKSTGHITDEDCILDIGPSSTKYFCKHIEESKLVLWNGPLGLFEDPRFIISTAQVARLIARLTTEQNLISIAGGGDIVAAISQLGLTKQFSYISTAGGAFLEWLEGNTLPGLAPLAQE